MFNRKRQKKEIETIKKRKITVKVSDADYEKLVIICALHGLTVGELIENFIDDLVDGTYSNGADEKMYIKQWFNRYRLKMSPSTFLNPGCNLVVTDPKGDILTKVKSEDKAWKKYVTVNSDRVYYDDDTGEKIR